MKAWPVFGIAIIQSILCLANWFLYRTWIDFAGPLSPGATLALQVAFAVLSLSFIVASFLGFRFSSLPVRSLYWAASVWLGLSNFLMVGACLAWLTDLALRFGMPSAREAARPATAWVLLAAAVIACAYGIANARRIRLRRVSVKLPNLPAAWRGRTALLVSDIHLGNINGVKFAKRIAEMAKKLNPAIVFVAGDLFDGTRADAEKMAGPLFTIAPPLGTYFVGGNHEQFGGSHNYEPALERAGFHVLHNRSVDVEGLQIIGVPYGHSTYPLQLRAFLEGLKLAGGPASIFLNHVPNRLPIAEHAGVSLQLSGHTHGGQIFPFSWITRRAFGKFTYGLQRFGDMQVYTSSGAGTWGPPMRVGTHPEIVLLTFE